MLYIGSSLIVIALIGFLLKLSHPLKQSKLDHHVKILLTMGKTEKFHPLLEPIRLQYLQDIAHSREKNKITSHNESRTNSDDFLKLVIFTQNTIILHRKWNFTLIWLQACVPTEKSQNNLIILS